MQNQILVSRESKGDQDVSVAHIFQSLLIFVFKPARSNSNIQPETLFTVFCHRRLEARVYGAFVAEPSSKECPYTFNVPIKVPASVETSAWEEYYHRMRKYLPFGIRMRSAHHLREIDNDSFASFPCDQDIKLVEISVDESGASESNNKIHQCGIESSRIRVL